MHLHNSDMMKKIILTLILTLLVSGCVNPFQPKQEVKEKPPDVIVIQNMNVLPTPPIIAGDQFSIYFEMVNEEENSEVVASYYILDDGLCVLREEGEVTDSGEFTFVPGQTEFIEWTFDTPQSSDIGFLTTTCPVRFRVSYGFRAISEIEVNVMDENRYAQLQQSGEFRTFTPTLTIGRGPLKVYMELGATLPIRTGRILPVYVTVEDKGTGLLSEIPANQLRITVPDGFTLDNCGDRFTCVGRECSNNQILTMIKRKSPTIRCSFITPDDIMLEQTYFITATLYYSYDVIKQVDVAIKPLQA